MDRDIELELIDELLALKLSRSHYLDKSVTQNRVEHYLSDERFRHEQAQIFRKTPLIVAHVSELAEPGDFLRREVAGRPVLLTRDNSGKVNAFLNVCRHRGTRLVDDDAGCKHRFSCPYHAWTYANTGELIAAPHFEEGFEGLDKADLSLKRLPCDVRHGFVWVTADPNSDAVLDTHIGEIAEELSSLNMENMVALHQDVQVYDANWKILAEGGIEAYHFKVAHKSTIGPHFEDNLSSYRLIGAHMRSILMRTSMAKLSPKTRDTWRLRDHAQVLYTLFPNAALLVQPDHIVWVNQEAISAGQTRIMFTTLVPKGEVSRTDHWERNHRITKATLNEDFAIGESIQASIASGANEDMLFGKFEGALHAFNQLIEAQLSDAPPNQLASQ